MPKVRGDGLDSSVDRSSGRCIGARRTDPAPDDLVKLLDCAANECPLRQSVRGWKYPGLTDT
jgi:hypothetical protein